MSHTFEVVASQVLTEKNFMGKKRHVHARTGERGQVIGVDPDDGHFTVRFHRSGTATKVVLGVDVVLTTESHAAALELLQHVASDKKLAPEVAGGARRELSALLR